MIIKAMVIGFIIGGGLGLWSSGPSGALALGVLGAIIAIPIRKWILRTFWH